MLTVLMTSLLLAQSIADPVAYRHEVEAWRQTRLQRLTADGGWLTVAGLFWLQPGSNRFGADPANPVLLPAHSSPPRAGAFVVEGGRVTVEVVPGVAVLMAGKPVTRAVLRSDAGGAPPDVLTLGALTLQIIDRGGHLGVRLKDMRSAARRDFKGLDSYPIDPAYRVVARFVAHPTPVTITVPSMIGIPESMPSPGFVTFQLGGKRLRLDPVIEPGDTQLFFIFRDQTAGRTTYGAGRFLYADPPKDGRVVLDFNRAYTPPCGFTPYATCPLPPEQNRLPIAIEAGERHAAH